MVWYTLSTLFAFHKNGAFKERYEFVENQDYVRFTENSVKPKERYDFVENQDFILVLNQQNKVSNKIIENQDCVRFTENWGTQRAVRIRGESRLCLRY